MRVIAGFHRSRLLVEVDAKSTREIKDRVKEAIFNSIGPYFANETVLDLFAGSGALGIEGISRGVNKAVFIDNNYRAIKTIKYNIASLRIEDESTVINTNYLDFIYKNYSKLIPIIGKFVVGEKEPYEYLIKSIDQFINQEELIELMKNNKFQNCSYRNFSGGIVSIHSGWKF